MRKHLTVALIPLLALLILPANAAGLVHPCYHPDVTPVLDGNVLDDPAWSNIPTATGFSVLGGDFTEVKQTSFQACWDDDALYFAIVCEEPDVAHLTSGMRDGGDAWLDDGVELFLQAGDGAMVFQYVVTSGGARASGEGAGEFLRIEVGTSATDASYTLEIAIPHEILKGNPQVGDLWRGNVCRNIVTRDSGGAHFTNWAPLERRFNEPENFADIHMRGPAPDAAQVAAIDETLNRRYRAHLLAQLREVAARAPEYLPALGEAVGDEEFGREARRLRNQWRSLQRLAHDTDAVPVAEVREMLKGADALAQASYDLKYAYLIGKLFTD